MAQARNSFFYWTSVLIYGVVLTAVLLYFRFPAEKFRSYCERLVETKIEGINCSINSINYSFPLTFAFKDVKLSRTEGNELILTDPQLLLSPHWKKAFSEIEVKSSALGSSSEALLVVDRENNRAELRDIRVSDLPLKSLIDLVPGLDRKMNGTVAVDGTVAINTEDFSLLEGKGNVTLAEGTIELKNPILEQTVLNIKEGKFGYSVTKGSIRLDGGEVKNPELTTTFSGTVALATPFRSGIVSLKGSVVPQAGLYQKNRQLKVIVARMQKRYRSTALPFTLAGTVGSPTFVFGK